MTGKPAGDDLTEGKRTVLVALALQGSRSPADAKTLDEALGQPLTGHEVAELQRIIERSGAHAEVERRIEELTGQSLSAIDGRTGHRGGPADAARPRGRRHPAGRLTARGVPERGAPGQCLIGSSSRSSGGPSPGG